MSSQLELEGMDLRSQRIKGSYIFRLKNEIFDKKEQKFGRKLLSNKQSEHTTQYGHTPEVQTDRVDVDNSFRLVQKVSQMERESKLMQEAKRDLQLQFNTQNLNSRKDKLKARKSRSMADLVMSHRKVFHVENIQLLRKKIEKDPLVADTVAKRLESYDQQVQKIPFSALNQRTKQMIIDKMDSISKENQKLARQLRQEKCASFFSNSREQSPQNGGSFFTNSKKPKLAESLKGLAARNAKVSTSTVDQTVLALIRRKKQEEELKKLEQQLKHESSARNLNP